MDGNLEARFKILRPLGGGGFGKVYKAKDQRLDYLVAIKMIVPQLGDDPKILAMMRDEAVLTRKLEDHPNIVKIYDLLEEAGQLAIIMEYIEGIDLGKFIRNFQAGNRFVPPRIALHIIGEVCKALDHAHNTKDKITGLPLKIVHRDVSPSNIMITFDGEVKVIDFGIAKAEFDARTTRTTSGLLKGKYHYLSPEHGSKTEMDGRSDIYPLGAVLYETLTGARLFDDKNTLELMDAARNAIIPIHKFESDRISPEVKRIIKKAVTKDINKRYQSALKMCEDIEAILQRLGARPGDLQRELAEIMSKFPVPDDDKFPAPEDAGLEPDTPLPPPTVFSAEPIPLKPPITPSAELTQPVIIPDAQETISIQETLRQPSAQAQKPGNIRNVVAAFAQRARALKVSPRTARFTAAILLTTLTVAAAIFFIQSKHVVPPPPSSLKFQIASNLDSAVVLVNGQAYEKTPMGFSWQVDAPFALALYRAGYDTVTGFYYRGNDDFQVTDSALWQYEKLPDASLAWQVTGNFYKKFFFKTTPVSARVFADNDTTLLGVTNQDSIRLLIGKRRVTLRPNLPGYLDENFDLAVDDKLGNIIKRTLRRDPALSRRLTIVAQDGESKATGNKVIARAYVVNVSDNTSAMLAVRVLGSQGTRRNVQMGIQYRVREFLPTPAEIELPRRAYKIKVAAPGYLDKTLDIAPDQTGEVVFVLERSPTTGVTIEVKDKMTQRPVLDGKVWFCKGKKSSDCLKEGVGFDGELFGELNAYGSCTHEFKSGRYMFKIECPGYEVYITPDPIEVIPNVGVPAFELTRKR